MFHSLNASFRSVRIRPFLTGLLVAAAGAGCAFQITKPLTLNTPMGLPAAAPLRVHTLKVAAPPAGTNVFVFADLTTGSRMSFFTGGPAGGMVMTTITVPAGLKRADFTYNLANDSAPLVSTALQGLFEENPGAGVDARVAADFKYGLTERKENVNLGFGNRNTIGLQMVVRVVLTSNGQAVLEKNYTAFESDSYSTSFLTYPSGEFLDALFQKALKGIRAQIAGDPEVAKHL